MNKRKFYSLIFLFTLSINGIVANSIQNNNYNRYRISLLTYDQGSELYSIFGHSALRVIDDSLNTDYIYNYGTFSFSNSNFYSDFLKGNLLYRLSKSPTEITVFRNNRNGRRIIENKLLLNIPDTRKLVSILEINNLPKNQRYYYDFFYDNCSTRLLQIIDTASGFKLKNTYENYTPISFRKHTNIYLKTKPWLRFGINTLMGALSDKKTVGVEAAFLPDYLRLILLENSELISPTNITLVQGKPMITTYNSSSILIMGMVFIISLLICFWEYKKRTIFKLFNHLLFWPAILIGFLILFLWYYSDLNIYNYNFNLLWASPIYLFILFKKPNKKLQIGIELCLVLSVVYTVIFTYEWIIAIYSLILFTRISNPFIFLKRLSPDII